MSHIPEPEPVYYLRPKRKPHNNFTFTAPKDMENCSDLHVTLASGCIVSTWEIPSLWERVKFLFKNEVSLSITGNQLPPVSLMVGDCIIVEKEN